MAELASVRHSLSQVLGHNYPRYLRSLTEWFGGKDSRGDLELELPFLTEPHVRYLHNKLMRGILVRSLDPDAESFPSFADASSYYFDYATDGDLADYASLLQSPSDNCITLHSAPNSQLSLPMSGLTTRRHHSLLQMSSFSLDPSSSDALFYDEDSEPPPKRDLFYVEMSRPNGEEQYRNEEDGPPAKYDLRLPVFFTKHFGRFEDQKNSLTPISRVTELHHVQKWLQKEPRLGKFFKSTQEAGQPEPRLRPANTVQGRFLARAWARGLKTVHPDAVALAIRATHEQIKRIVIALVKQRKGYDLQNGAAVNIGLPYPNSYLLSGPHRVDSMSPPFTSRLVEPLQIPQLVESSEELERLSVMRYATALMRQPRYESRIGPTELLTLIQSEPSIIPSHQARHKLVEKLFLRAKGAFESPLLPTEQENGFEDMEEEEGELLADCTY